MGNQQSEPQPQTKQETKIMKEPEKILPKIHEVEVKIDQESELCPLPILKEFFKLLPSHLRNEQFILMYSSKKHGHNILAFQEKVVGRGPCLVLVKSTKSKHIFGCFASKSWKTDNDFYGDTNSFLFSFDEKLYTFKPGNYNQNFQFFNHGSKYNKYNGLGFGGRIGFFSFSLDDDLKKGKTNAETMTFPTSPCLCHPSSCTDKPLEDQDPNFEAEIIEVIGFPLTKEDRINLEYEKQMRESKRDVEDEGVDSMILEVAGVKNNENRGDVF